MPSDHFTLHIIPGYIENLFLVEYDHGLLLLDCGAVSDVKRLEDFCREKLHRSPTEIKLAVVTHMHPDHAGGAVLLREKFGIPLAAHKDLDRWYAGPGGFMQKVIDCALMQSVARRTRGKLEKGLFNSHVQADYLLADGDALPFFPDWTTVLVPGHTSHDLVLHNAKESLLYVADCFLEVKGKYQTPLPVMFPQWLHASYAKMDALKASSLLIAHGEARRDNIAADLFISLQDLLLIPPNKLTRRIKRLSIYTPEWRRQNMLQKSAPDRCHEDIFH
ncbi:MAG TPA: MBL fold metallo-hydrolase [Syntrophomonas sp.]|nr:MBL fold metallo-hydrolase [Syntrophomonas sp.]